MVQFLKELVKKGASFLDAIPGEQSTSRLNNCVIDHKNVQLQKVFA